MATARRKQICLSVTPFYHCVTRCVRRAYLCGYDKKNKRHLSHRKQWIEDRLIRLTDAFCIDVAGFAVMSNHYHVVLKVDLEKAKTLSDHAVVDRWLTLYRGTPLMRRYRAGEKIDKSELETVRATVTLYRDHLTNISRFMGNLNEYIARRANHEDGVPGVFWESRFKSQALLDDEALLRTLCYVDLNPVRAKIANTPELSKHTSVHRRLKKRKTGLMPFLKAGESVATSDKVCLSSIPVTFKHYLEILDWTGRLVRAGKRGLIGKDMPSIIERLGYTPQTWLLSQSPNVRFKQKALGSRARIREYCDGIKQRWIWQTH